MTGYLLDTNILSDLVRNPAGKVTQRIQHIGDGNVATSIIAAAKLRFGAEKKGSQRLSDQVETVLDAIEILPFEPPADATYAIIRANLEKTRRPIAANDLLIAAHAITLDCTLVTDNERDFWRIRGLSSVNWLR
ncbi:MAG TPA: type II toxin-antitoxin system VapC family toxin [Hyphomicrobiaceae bacterium]|nr:type II toxin-antitoxin system VapC family toxin [Hyphomicrobiaceae bacterium]